MRVQLKYLFAIFFLSCFSYNISIAQKFERSWVRDYMLNWKVRIAGTENWAKYNYIDSEYDDDWDDDTSEWVNPWSFNNHQRLVASEVIEGEKRYDYNLMRFNIDSLRKYEEYDFEFSSEPILIYDYLNTKTKFFIKIQNIDTYADIYFNDSLVYKNRNNFIEKYIDVSNLVKPNDTNWLFVRVYSTTKMAKDLYKKDSIRYPSDNEDAEYKTSQFTRESHMQYGWDFAPRYLTTGLGKGIRFIQWNDFLLLDQYVLKKEIIGKDAKMMAVFELQATENCKVGIKYDSDNDAGAILNDSIKIKLKKGFNKIEIPFTVKNFEKWWPATLQYQYDSYGGKGMYYFHSKIYSLNQESDDKYSKYGISDIKLARRKDSIGENFYFKANGNNIYIKGANIVPRIYDLTNREYDEVNYDFNDSYYQSPKEIVGNISEQGFNMIRVWGGGEYLDEEFYEMCDYFGIMVWQDFMFSGTMYPSDSAFLNNVKEEAEFQVKRLSKHPCMALWCGNNEIEVAWENWGWQKKYKYSSGQIKELETGYQKIFNEILPNAVKKYGNGIDYLNSSPVSNWGKKEDFAKGDNHYWGVWHGEQPIDSFNTSIPRFMSEYGMQSFPNISTIHKYFFGEREYWNPNDKINLNSYNENSPEFAYRQKSYKGNKLLRKYIEDYYGEPKDFESFLILTQMFQAEAYKMAIEAHRRAKPYCMGTMFWQLNDAWPGASWSTIDYSGEYKLAHYAVMDAYKQIIISAVEEKENFNIYVISDKIKSETGLLEMKLMDFYGNIKSDSTINIDVLADSSRIIFSIPSNVLIADSMRNQLFIHCELKLNYEDKGYKENYTADDLFYYFVKPKDLDLPYIDYFEQFNSPSSHVLKGSIISKKVLLKNVFVFPDTDFDNFDNNVDVLPGESFQFVECDNIDCGTGRSTRSWSCQRRTLSLYDLLKKYNP